MLNIKKLLTKLLEGIRKALFRYYSSGTFDLDDFYQEGRYYFGSGCTLSNVPNSAVNGWLEVMPAGQNVNTCKQIWHRQGSNPTTFRDEYIRLRSGTTWGSWERLISESYLTSVLGSYASSSTAMGNPTIASGTGATVAANASGKTDKNVSINLRLTGATLSAGTADICTLPSGFRPKAQAFAALLINSVYRNGAILTDGTVRVYSGAAVSSVEIKILSSFITS